MRFVFFFFLYNSSLPLKRKNHGYAKNWTSTAVGGANQLVRESRPFFSHPPGTPSAESLFKLSGACLLAVCLVTEEIRV